MRYSRLFLPTLKEVPAEAEVISHRLMLRAGMIRKLAAGLYTYLPLGLRAVRKVENIIREEMNRAGAQEVMMPVVQPAELWKESGRWDHYGRELLRMHDRHDRECCLGPTHEEVITALVRGEVRSYRDLPLNLYQIQTKFRDEIRPRFGLMRGREFIMKDAYSFDADEEALDVTYQGMYRAYSAVFERCGLDFRAVEADTGSIGGHASHEFMVMADTGEDDIVCCTQCSYAANVELAPVVTEYPASTEAERPLERKATPGKKTVEEVTGFLESDPSTLIKTLLFRVDDKRFVAAMVRGDHEINEVKLMRIIGAETLEMAAPGDVERITGARVGFAGPMGLKEEVEIVADLATAGMKNFIAGANETDTHFINMNWERDVKRPAFHDIRVMSVSDPCPKCRGDVDIRRGIEVGHIFKLGTKYSEALNATFLDSNGKERPMIMGCYGIGVGRTVAAAIEQNHDDAGIIFPLPIAPFQVIISLMNSKDAEMVRVADEIYSGLGAAGIECLYDDRKERPGVKFKDAELTGIPFRITVGKKTLKDGKVEVTERASGSTEECPLESVVDHISRLVN